MYASQDNLKPFTSYWVKAQPVVNGVICAAVTNRHDAEDILQEVALTAANDFAKYDQLRPFLPWVLTIARHRIADYFRKSRRHTLTFDDETLEILADSAGRIASRVSDREAALSECMSRLPERGERLIEMRYHLDMSADAIGRKLGLSSAAVFSALHRLRLALSRCIEDRVQSMEGGAGE